MHYFILSISIMHIPSCPKGLKNGSDFGIRKSNNARQYKTVEKEQGKGREGLSKFTTPLKSGYNSNLCMVSCSTCDLRDIISIQNKNKIANKLPSTKCFIFLFKQISENLKTHSRIKKATTTSI